MLPCSGRDSEAKDFNMLVLLASGDGLIPPDLVPSDCVGISSPAIIYAFLIKSMIHRSYTMYCFTPISLEHTLLISFRTFLGQC